MTDAQRIDPLKTETAQSRQRLKAIEELLFRAGGRLIEPDRNEKLPGQFALDLG